MTIEDVKKRLEYTPTNAMLDRLQWVDAGWKPEKFYIESTAQCHWLILQLKDVVKAKGVREDIENYDRQGLLKKWEQVRENYTNTIATEFLKQYSHVGLVERNEDYAKERLLCLAEDYLNKFLGS